MIDPEILLIGMLIGLLSIYTGIVVFIHVIDARQRLETFNRLYRQQKKGKK